MPQEVQFYVGVELDTQPSFCAEFDISLEVFILAVVLSQLTESESEDK